MNSPDKTSTIVLVGQWNVFILTPQWVGKNLFQEVEIKLQMELSPLGGIVMTGNLAEIVPTSGRVILVALRSESENLDKIEGLFRNLLGKLPHTPMSAIGINHAWVESHPPESLLAVFKLADVERLKTCLPVVHTGIARRLQGEGFTLNVSMSKLAESDEVRFDFNFHYDVSGKEEPSLLMKPGIVKEHFGYTRRLLEEHYGLAIDE